MDMMNYIIWKYFYRKPEEILSFLMILDENPNFPPKFVKNLHIQHLNKKKKKIKVQILYFFYIFILLDLFYDCANFQVNRSISCRDLRGGGGGQNSPPPPQWTQVLKITQWD